jgi:hypothetical protein
VEKPLAKQVAPHFDYILECCLYIVGRSINILSVKQSHFIRGAIESSTDWHPPRQLLHFSQSSPALTHKGTNLCLLRGGLNRWRRREKSAALRLAYCKVEIEDVGLPPTPPEAHSARAVHVTSTDVPWARTVYIIVLCCTSRNFDRIAFGRIISL